MRDEHRTWRALSARMIAVAAIGTVGIHGATILHPATPAAAAFPGSNGRIAYVSSITGNQEIFVVDSDGTNPVNLTKSTGADVDPAFSADGSKIAFTSSRTGNSEVFVMNADGSGQTNITNSPGSESEPAWSPDGSKIVFTRFISGVGGQIWVMNADGTNQVLLAGQRSYCGGNSSPAWSPDGARIAFFSVRACSLHTFVMNADGSGQTNLGEGQNPAWSPDGTRLVVAACHGPDGTRS